MGDIKLFRLEDARVVEVTSHSVAVEKSVVLPAKTGHLI